MVASRRAGATTSVHVFGANERGALCLPHCGGVVSPTRLLALRSHFVRCAGVSEGWTACASSAGVLFAWGRDELPLPVGHLPSGCCALACGPRHVHLLTDDGEVFSWEYSLESTAPPPQRMALPVDIEQIACGGGHVVALAEGLALFSWGRGAEGQLGRPPPLVECELSPRRVEDLPTGGVLAIACGGCHTVVVASSGELLGCGPRALLALPTSGAADVQPTLIDIAGPWQAEAEADAESGGLVGVACGRAHTLALSAAGRVYSFGEGARGQLGHGGGGRGGGRPMRVGGALVAAAIDRVWASAGCDASFARGSADGETRSYAWGALPAGEGDAALAAAEEIAELRGLETLSIHAASSHCVALLSSGAPAPDPTPTLHRPDPTPAGPPPPGRPGTADARRPRARLHFVAPAALLPTA